MGRERGRWEREREVAAREKSNERKRLGGGGWGAHGGRGARGTRAGLGQAGSHCGSKSTTRTTTNRNPIANQNPKRNETNMRLTTTSDKEIFFSMMQHP
jgi:ribosomal protein L15